MRKLIFALALFLAGGAVLLGPAAAESRMEADTNRPGGDYDNFQRDDAAGCQLTCRLERKSAALGHSISATLAAG
jgi:hypothetical protein